MARTDEDRVGSLVAVAPGFHGKGQPVRRLKGLFEQGNRGADQAFYRVFLQVETACLLGLGHLGRLLENQGHES